MGHERTIKGSGKFMKIAFYVQWYDKRHLSGWSNAKQQQSQAHTLSHCQVAIVWRDRAGS